MTKVYMDGGAQDDDGVLAYTSPLEIVCNECGAETIVLVTKWGQRFMSKIVSCCPRCGGRNVDAYEGWEPDTGRNGRPRIKVVITRERACGHS